MKFSDTLALLRKEAGFSQAQVAEHLRSCGFDITHRAVSKWECGATAPNYEQFLMLCRLYGVRDVLSVFFGLEGELDGLNELGKKRVAEYIRMLRHDEMFAAAPKIRPRLLRTIPLYDLPVSAGTGQFLDRSDYEHIEVDDSVPLSATFAVRISGDSMSPDFSDGQVVYVRQQQTLSFGDIGIFLLNGSAYCKKLGGKDGEAELISLNRNYAPIKVSEADELRVLGKVVA